jgi:hypothetical protein
VAEAETRAIIELVGGGMIEAHESPDELERRFSRGGASPFQKVEDIRGRQHWVNLAQVTEIYEPPAAGSA